LPGAKLLARRRALTGAWERFRDTGSAAGVRAEVAASWDRSTSVLERPVEAAPVDPDEQVRAAWASSPLRSAIADVAEDVDATTRDFDLVAAVTDASGRILWAAGGRHMRDRAAAVNFVPGGRWDEASVGTNALDLALRSAQPAMVFSAEHYSPAVHGWVCYAAPLVDRRDGRVLGVLDLSTTWERSNPMALATVTAFARTISQSVSAMVRRPGGRPDEPDLQADAAPPLRLEVLGRPRVWQGGVPVMLPLRQAEILLALAEHPRGLTVDQLAAHVYGDQPVSTSTVKAEMSRLRRVLPGVIASRPYRLVAPTCVDALALLERVAAGDARGAAEGFTDDVLPASEAPVARGLALRVEVAVRSLVLRSADAEAAVALAMHRRDDLEVVDHALTLLPTGAPRRALLEGERTAALRD
jgi:GAF domain